MKEKKRFIGIVIAVFIVGIVIGVICVSGYQTLEKKKEEQKKEAKEANYKVQECIALGKYSGLTVSLKPTDEDVQTEVDSLLEENTTYEQKSGTVQSGDQIYADFEGYINGKKKDDTCGSDYITIGSGEWLAGFEDALVGVRTGQTKEFSIQVPEGTYGDDTVDGHKIDFKVHVQYICGDSIVPDYNDQFVQSVTNYKSVKEYEKYLRQKLEKENEEDKLDFPWTKVLEESKVTKYPKSLLKAAKKEVLQGYYDMADIYGVSHDEIFQSFGCEDEADFKKTQLSDLAKDTVKEKLVAAAIAEKEKLNYTTEEYDALLKEEYESNSDSYANKKEYEKANKEYLQRTALENVVKEWIGEHTTFTK